jgi:hypothetical protein
VSCYARNRTTGASFTSVPADCAAAFNRSRARRSASAGRSPEDRSAADVRQRVVEDGGDALGLELLGEITLQRLSLLLQR